MKIVKFFIATLLLLLGNHASAANVPSHFPTDLMYAGKPVDPLCFANLASKTNVINLEKCGVENDKLIIEGSNADLLKKGFVGFDLKDNDHPAGYSYYKPLDAGDKQYWIYSINSGGGSGEFTAITQVKRINTNELSTKDVIGGDRCNGGVQDVKEQNHSISYSVELTAYDLFAMADSNPHKLKAYDDLAACAVCCAAKVVYDTDANLKMTLKYIELDKVKNTKEMNQQGTHQACFNKIYASYVTKHGTHLDEAKLKSLVQDFNNYCFE